MATVAKKKPTPARKPANPWPAKLAALRARLGLTVEQAAERVGVKPRTWQAWEQPSQRRAPSPSHAILIGLLERGKI